MKWKRWWTTIGWWWQEGFQFFHCFGLLTSSPCHQICSFNHHQLDHFANATMSRRLTKRRLKNVSNVNLFDQFSANLQPWTSLTLLSENPHLKCVPIVLGRFLKSFDFELLFWADSDLSGASWPRGWWGNGSWGGGTKTKSKSLSCSWWSRSSWSWSWQLMLKCH